MSQSSRLLAAGMVLAAAALISPLKGARAQGPTFRAGIDLLTIDVTALDRDDRPVRDLRSADFAVVVGGQPRKVVAARFYGTTAAPDASAGTGATPAGVLRPADAPGRTVMFVVDRDSLKPGNEQAMLRATSVVFDGLAPADATGLVGVPVGGVELTREHQRVRAALPMMTGTRPREVNIREKTVSWDEALAFERRDTRVINEVIYRECYQRRAEPNGLRNPCPDDLRIQTQEFLQIGRAQVRTTLHTLGDLVDQLLPIRGPKHIILISGGLGFDPELLADFNRFARKAAAAQVMIYAVHLDQPDADASDGLRVASAFGGQTLTGGLDTITGMTGGTVFKSAGSAGGVFERISDQINNFYQLAVETRPDDAAGTLQSVAVSVTRPDVHVRARREIAAIAAPATPRATDPITELLRQPTDIAEMPVAVATYTTRGTDDSRLRVLISGEIGAGPSLPAADFGFAVLTEGNVVATGRQHLEAATAGPQVITMAALLLPGQYRLRYATSGADGRAGAADVPLSVGLRAAGEFQVSDLIVGVADAGRLQPRRRVRRGVPLAALIELLSADPARLELARVTLEVIPAGSAQPVLRLLMAAKNGSGATVLLNQASIDTARLEPGRYTATAIPVLGDQPLGRVSRLFEVQE